MHSKTRILVVSDTDSYLKWAVGTVDRLGPGPDVDIVVVSNPIEPSAEQRAAATRGTRFDATEVVTETAAALRRRVRRTRPDVVLLATTGPVFEAVSRTVLPHGRHRPVVVTGLPGIAAGAARAWRFRSTADVFVAHSVREAARFYVIRAELGADCRIGLAHLPFLATGPVVGPAPDRPRVVFATQALVPARRSQRVEILLALRDLAVRHPGIDVVVKLRATLGEEQTHHETFHYQALWEDLTADGTVRGDEISFRTGAMSEYLVGAVGFVTVSSTAALEATAAGVPTIVLVDFGLGREMINDVFIGSGMTGTLADLRAMHFNPPPTEWLQHNYLHPQSADTWWDVARRAVARAHSDPGLPAPVRGVHGHRLSRRLTAVARLWLPESLIVPFRTWRNDRVDDRFVRRDRARAEVDAWAAAQGFGAAGETFGTALENAHGPVPDAPPTRPRATAGDRA